MRNFNNIAATFILSWINYDVKYVMLHFNELVRAWHDQKVRRSVSHDEFFILQKRIKFFWFKNDYQKKSWKCFFAKNVYPKTMSLLSKSSLLALAHDCSSIKIINMKFVCFQKMYENGWRNFPKNPFWRLCRS